MGKVDPELFETATREELETKGARPDLMWSDTLRRYVTPTAPKLGLKLEVLLSDGSTRTIVQDYARFTAAWGTQLNRMLYQTPLTFVRVLKTTDLYTWRKDKAYLKGEKAFHLPVTIAPLIDEEFEKIKAEHVAKYGYKVEMPEFGDVLHFTMPVHMSDEEATLWGTGRKDEITPYRRAMIEEAKADKKRRYMMALGSPNPKIIRGIAAWSTMVDNAQDTLITAALVGRIGIKVFPKFAKRIAPAYGICATGADILNIMALFTLAPFAAKSLKRMHFGWSELNPFSKASKLRRAKKMLQWKPDFADIIQALQVSDSICGVGVCLGPIMGWAQDFIAGEVRTAMGQKVTWSPGAQKMRVITRFAAWNLFHMPILWTGGQVMTDEDHAATLWAALGAVRLMQPVFDDPENLQFQEDPTTYQVRAPRQRDILSLEALQELGVDVEKTSVWPHTGTEWCQVSSIMDDCLPDVIDNLRSLLLRQNRTELGIAIGGLMNQLAPEMLALYGGETEVIVDHDPLTVVAHNLLLNNHYLPYDYTQEQARDLAHWIKAYHQDHSEPPPTKDVIRRGEGLGIQWRHTLPSKPTGKAAEIWPDLLELKEKYPEDAWPV